MQYSCNNCLYTFKGGKYNIRENLLLKGKVYYDITNKKINNQIGVAASLNTMNKTVNNIKNDKHFYWNQMSDRKAPATFYKKYNLNSTFPSNSNRSTKYSNKPGSTSLGGYGVDIKHNSYQRYLLKKKKNIICC